MNIRIIPPIRPHPAQDKSARKLLMERAKKMGRKTVDVVEISQKGTIPISKKVRDKLGWKKGDSLVLVSEDGKLVLEKED